MALNLGTKLPLEIQNMFYGILFECKFIESIRPNACYAVPAYCPGYSKKISMFMRRPPMEDDV